MIDIRKENFNIDKILKDIKFFLFEPESMTENKTISDIRIENSNTGKKLKDIKLFLFEPGNEDYYEPIRISSVFNKNYIEYESNADKDYQLNEYLDKIRPYLNNMINDLKTQD